MPGLNLVLGLFKQFKEIKRLILKYRYGLFKLFLKGYNNPLLVVPRDWKGAHHLVVLGLSSLLLQFVKYIKITFLLKCRFKAVMESY